MAEIKTKANAASVAKFLAGVKDPERRADGQKVCKLMQKITRQKPVMWGSSIVGFGKFHYKSERSRQEGDWPMVGFSPRKQNLTVYIMPGFKKDYASLLKQLGPHSVSAGSCLYINHLSKIHLPTLEKIIARSYKDMQKKYKTS